MGRTAALMTKLSRTFTPIRRRESDSACDSEREGGSAELWEIEFVGIWCCVLCVYGNAFTLVELGVLGERCGWALLLLV